MAEIDLTLPSKAPEMEAYIDIGTDLMPFTFYNCLDITDDEFKTIKHSLETCNGEDGPFDLAIVAPPQPHFRGGPLGRVYEYHLELVKDGVFNPFYFAALTSENWEEEGVLLVTLNDVHEEDGKEDWFNVDAIHIDPNELCLLIVNFQVSNTDWYETKENYALPRPNTSDDNFEDEEEEDEIADD